MKYLLALILVLITAGLICAQTPVTVNREFVQGNYPNCVQPYSNGVAITSYQNDVKNRWPDGSLKTAVVSFIDPAYSAGTKDEITMESVSCSSVSPLTSSQMLASNFDFDARMVLTGTNSPTVSARAILQAFSNANSGGACTDPGSDPDGSSSLCRYWLKGPVVTAVILEDRQGRTFDVNTDNNPGGASSPLHPYFVAYFYPSTNQVLVEYTLENIWASTTALKSARDQAFSLVLQRGNASPTALVGDWGSGSQTFITRTVFHRTYCVSGTNAGIRNTCNPGLVFDYGYGYLSQTKFFPNWDPNLVLSQTYVNSLTTAFNAAATNKSLAGSTANGLGFYPAGVSGCGGSNASSTGDGCTTGEDGMNQSGAAYFHGPLTTWALICLLTSDSGACGTVTLGNADLGYEIPYFYREADTAAGHGGGFLATNSNSATPTAGSIGTLGRVISVNARTEVNLQDTTFQGPSGTACNTTYPTDWINFGGSGQDVGAFSGETGSSHWPNLAFVPYLFTGLYGYYEEQILQSAYAIGMAGDYNPGSRSCYQTSANGSLRMGAAGYWQADQERGNDWMGRENYLGAFLAVDGSPEKTYLTDKVNMNVAVWEGTHNITCDVTGTGLTYPYCGGSTSISSAWGYGQFGRKGNANQTGTPIGSWAQGVGSTGSLGYAQNYPICIGNTIGNTGSLGSNQTVQGGGITGNPTGTFWAGGSCPTTPPVGPNENANSNFQNDYSTVTIGWLNDLGFCPGSCQILNYTANFFLNQALNPAANIFRLGQYVFPTVDNSSVPIASWSSVPSFYVAGSDPTAWPEAQGGFGCPSGNTGGADEWYIAEGMSAMSYLTGITSSQGGYNGLTAYNKIRTGNGINICLPYFSGVGLLSPNFPSPKWDIVPRTLAATASAPVLPVVVTPTFNPAGGTYTSTQNVVISTTTTGATLCYTVDGSTPTTNGGGSCTHGTSHVTPVTVSVATSQTVNVVGTLTGDTDSALATAAYTINPFPWSPLIAPNRAIDWSQAGIPTGLPDTAWTQCGTTIAAYTGTTAAINTAIAGCSAQTFVLLGPGTFNLTGQIALTKGQVVLRGSGANSTFLVPSGAAGQPAPCNTGFTMFIGMCGPDSSSQNAGTGPTSFNTWTAGYAQNSNQITVGTWNGSSTVNLASSTTPSLIYFSQCETGYTGFPCAGANGDNGNYFDCGDPFVGQFNPALTYSNGNLTLSGGSEYQYINATPSAGNTPPNATFWSVVVSGGQPTTTGIGCAAAVIGTPKGNWNNRWQYEIGLVTNVTGNTITLLHPLENQNWASGQTPMIYKTTAMIQAGLENLSIDAAGITDSSFHTMEIYDCYQCFVSGVTFLNETAASINIQQASHTQIQNNYFSQARLVIDNYGIRTSISVADNLFQNNIFQGIRSSIVFSGSDSGSVVAYNFSVNQEANAGTNMWQAYWAHARNGVQLFESNIGTGIELDDIHGTKLTSTLFRNFLYGWESCATPAFTLNCSSSLKSQQTESIVITTFNRYENLIANVLGTPGWHNIYTNAPSGTNPFAPQTIYILGAGNPGTSGPTGQPVDTFVYPSAMLWANWDNVSSPNLRCQTSEVPTSIPLYPNPVPTSYNCSTGSLPASFYLPGKPGWWQVSGVSSALLPYPAIGPDITTGNLGQCAGTLNAANTFNGLASPDTAHCAGGAVTAGAWGGHINWNPAMAAYLKLGGNLDGTSASIPFDAGIYSGSLVTINTPTFSPVAGNYTTTQSVTISTTTAGATICFTTDGSTPTATTAGTCSHGTAGTAGSSSVTVSVAVSETLNAIGTESGFTNSSVGTAAYTISTVIDTPTFSPTAGTYTTVQNVTISTIVVGDTICYTVDNSTPTGNGAGVCTHGTTYSSPVQVAVSETLRAIGSKSGNTDSAVGSATYTINLQPVATPTFSPIAGAYTTTQNITISSTTTPTPTFCYSTNGTNPTTNGAGSCTLSNPGTVTYSGPVAISSTPGMTLKAIGTEFGFLDSSVGSANYIVGQTVANPIFNPAAGTYTSSQSVTLTDSTSGATICYTNDGSTPTADSSGNCTGTSFRYTSAIPVSSTTTLNAIGALQGYFNSAPTTAIYTIAPPSNVISPARTVFMHP